MKTFLYSLILFVSIQVVFSQNQLETVTNFLYDTRGAFYPGKQYFMAEPVPTEISGKIYLDESWQEGAVLSQNDESGNAQIRYNVLSDEMQVNVDGKILALTISKIKALRIEQQIFIPAPHVNEQRSTAIGYFELLVEGEIALLRRYRCITHATEYHPAVATARDQEYIIENELYFRREKDYAKPLKRGKKNVLAVFSENKKDMEKYTSSNKLNLRKEEAIIHIFSYYNKSRKKT